MLTSTWIRMDHPKMFQSSSGPPLLHNSLPIRGCLGKRSRVETERKRGQRGGETVKSLRISAAQSLLGIIYFQGVELEYLTFCPRIKVSLSLWNIKPVLNVVFQLVV